MLLLLACPAAAIAGPAEELSALFSQTCLPYAGRPAALRRWAAAEKLPEVAEPARARFTNGAPGKVFDASNAAGKVVLVSSDDGICAVVTDKAGDKDIAAALEGMFRAAAISFRLVIERDDTAERTLHHREYLATQGKRAWKILAATVRDGAPGQAMLTAAPQ